MGKILLLNGPNLNLLGKREKEIYGDYSLEDIENSVKMVVHQKGYTVDCVQSNHEGFLVDRLQEAVGKYDGIIFNPAAYTHTSVALLDAIRAIDLPVIEVHLSNIHSREDFRRQSMTAPACVGQILGLGIAGYRLAAMALIDDIISSNSHSFN